MTGYITQEWCITDQSHGRQPKHHTNQKGRMRAMWAFSWRLLYVASRMRPTGWIPGVLVGSARCDLRPDPSWRTEQVADGSICQGRCRASRTRRAGKGRCETLGRPMVGCAALCKGVGPLGGSRVSNARPIRGRTHRSRLPGVQSVHRRPLPSVPLSRQQRNRSRQQDSNGHRDLSTWQMENSTNER